MNTSLTTFVGDYFIAMKKEHIIGNLCLLYMVILDEYGYFNLYCHLGCRLHSSIVHRFRFNTSYMLLYEK
jgi:hypothetical protein